MDGNAVKSPVLAGIVTRYRSMAKSRQPFPELLEAPPLSLRVQDRLADLHKFYEFYEQFVEVLCDAAQLGVKPTFEQRYASSRHELIHRYAALRKFVGAYVRPCGEDSKWSTQGICFDVFDSLMAPSSLELFLQADDGYTISRINRTREALNLYGEHLRQLVERTK